MRSNPQQKIFGAQRVVSPTGFPHSPPPGDLLARHTISPHPHRKDKAMKTIPLFALSCVALVVSGCGSTASYQSRRRGPVWVVPATSAVVAAPLAATATSAPASETNSTASVAVPASAPTLKTNVPPVANVLSVAEIKEMAGKGVSEQTLLNVLRASRAIYTLTTQDVSELQEAKVSRVVIDYLLSTPLLYKDDLLRSHAYYNYTPVYPGYWHWSYYESHHDVHHYEPPHSYGHHDSHSGGLHH